ncbi:MAG: SoxR reducing system RseC family protein [Clostridia bacterium]|nr:SoxR reducing system RseC family protein [Clostridia bacterium]
MTEKGIVVNIENNVATVRIGRSSACGNCNMCGMSEEKKHVDLYVDNVLHAENGDVVQLEIIGSSATRTSLIAYLMPLVLALCAMAVALLCGANDWVLAIVFVLGLALGYFAIWLLDKKLGKKLGVKATMTSIISDNTAVIIEENNDNKEKNNE